ncbi:hypothetical protein H072_6267 [Dactylellina haptotyla CBS 200.50]|uniref:CBM-cenC domain-containing protein n=1 Tax=Dactylellina haptotyla (strain CBS 200.50) TaxID=1284197 RepID=S8BX75_DACHA|nr:hypothetical protein H072_6267 [Dactylellina haptotyla CBS 200.50]
MIYKLLLLTHFLATIVNAIPHQNIRGLRARQASTSPGCPVPVTKTFTYLSTATGDGSISTAVTTVAVLEPQTTKSYTNGFETPDTNWVVESENLGGAVDYSTATGASNAHSGTKFLKVNFHPQTTDLSWFGTYTNPDHPIALTPNTLYEYGYYVKKLTGATFDLTAQIAIYRNGENVAMNSMTLLPSQTSTSWTLISIQFNPGDNANVDLDTAVLVRCAAGPVCASAKVAIDDIYIKDVV